MIPFIISLMNRDRSKIGGKSFLSIFMLVALFLSNLPSANAFSISNSIAKEPPLSKHLSVYLLDLSSSVDHQVVIAGLSNLRNNVANVYAASDIDQKIPASSYYQWIPIRGSEANSASLPLFTEEDDEALWSAVRLVKGKSNQLIVLKKLQERGGLWSQLMTYRGLSTSNCMSVAYQSLKNPGLSGETFKVLNQNVCSTALRVRSRFTQVQTNIQAFTGPNPTKATSGTDVLGTIRKLENNARNSTGLQRYDVIRLIFVSDMVHQTAQLDMQRQFVAKSASDACSYGKDLSGGSSGFDKSLFQITIYGLGEMKEDNKNQRSAIAANEKLYIPLRSFWDCYWIEKGLKLPQGEFKTLSSFSDDD